MRFYHFLLLILYFERQNHSMSKAILTIYALFACLLTAMADNMRVGDDDEQYRMKAYPGGKQFMTRLTLKDKEGTADINHPETFLSERSLKRRNRQGIAIDSTDLPVSDAYLSDLRAQGVEVVCKSKWNNTVVVRHKSRQMVRTLMKLPYVVDAKVVWIAPDSIKISSKHRTAYKSELNVWDDIPSSDYGASYAQVSMIHADNLHNRGCLGEGMTIAVLDGGFQNVDRIPAFRDVNIIGAADFVFADRQDIYLAIDHGTKVLSTMAIDIPGLYRGTAPKASYLLLRCEDSTTEQLVEEDYWVAAAEYADSVGVDIITSSLGYHNFDHKEMNYRYSALDGHSLLISRTAGMLASKGIVMVNSAGNDGMSSWKKINAPADADDIITVGAVTPQGVNAAFSSVGPTADGRVKPDVMALGSPSCVISGKGTMQKNTGTSFAAPQIAGAIACLWQSNRSLTAAEVIDLVRRTASNAASPDNIMGYGIADFSKR